jgi:hypothetical protein
MTVEPSSWLETELKEPLRTPMGVLTAETITASAAIIFLL